MPNDYYNQLENGIIALLNIIKEYKILKQIFTNIEHELEELNK